MRGFAVIAILAVFGYVNFGFSSSFGRFINHHDVFHYYLGAKYFKEVGYFNLYNAALVADHEGGRVYKYSLIRNLENERFDRVSEVLKKGPLFKSHFTLARWDEFKKDVVFFQSMMPKKNFQGVFRDKGIHASPFWNMVAQRFIHWIPIGSDFGINALVSLDILLLVIMVLMIHRAFGTEVTMLAIIFLGTNFFMSTSHIRGAFLRLDWLTLLVISLCLLKMERMKLAACLMAYASLARIFPLFFIFGMVAKMLWDIIERRCLSKPYRDFFITYVAGCTLLFGLSVLNSGLEDWVDFFKKSLSHVENLTVARVGFKYVFLLTYHNWFENWAVFKAHKLILFQNLVWLWWTMQAIVVLVLFYCVRRLKDFEAMAISYVLVFFLTAPQYYYQTMLMIPFFFFASYYQRLNRFLGMVFIFCISLIAYILHSLGLPELDLRFLLSVLLFVFSCYLIFCGFKVQKEIPQEV